MLYEVITFIDEPELLAGWLSARNVKPRSRRNGAGDPAANSGAEPSSPASAPGGSEEVKAA